MRIAQVTKYFYNPFFRKESVDGKKRKFKGLDLAKILFSFGGEVP